MIKAKQSERLPGSAPDLGPALPPQGRQRTTLSLSFAQSAHPKGDHMAGRNFLFVPGPTNVPDRVLRAMAVPMEDHRSSAFPALTLECLAGLRKVFKTTTAAPMIFPSSGTGCWEAALTNCLDPGDRVLASSFGQFSYLWIDMCRRLGLSVEALEVEWGEGTPVERYRA